VPLVVGGGAVSEGYQGGVGRVPVAKEEQEMIAERVVQVDDFIQRTQTVVAKLGEQKQGLMQDLLTGRVRVPETKGAA
jgi:restriction endonuclease S subunit